MKHIKKIIACFASAVLLTSCGGEAINFEKWHAAVADVPAQEYNRFEFATHKNEKGVISDSYGGTGEYNSSTGIWAVKDAFEKNEKNEKVAVDLLSISDVVRWIGTLANFKAKDFIEEQEDGVEYSYTIGESTYTVEMESKEDKIKQSFEFNRFGLLIEAKGEQVSEGVKTTRMAVITYYAE